MHSVFWHFQLLDNTHEHTIIDLLTGANSRNSPWDDTHLDETLGRRVRLGALDVQERVPHIRALLEHEHALGHGAAGEEVNWK